MNYDEVVAVFFEPSPPGAEPTTASSSSPARRLRDAIEPIAMHAVWSRSVNERLAALGLDFLSGYLWARAAALGEPEPGVVAATFAWFEPGMIASTYEAGRAACSRADVLAARATAGDSLRQILGDTDVAATAAALRAVVPRLDVTGRPLFAGLASLPWPDDPYGELWRACELLREHRGDAHVAVVVAEGLHSADMNVLTEVWLGMPFGSYSATRAWAPEVLEAARGRLRAAGLLDDDGLTEQGRARRQAIEDRTDALEADVVTALGDDLDAHVARLSEWSERCIEAGAFPPDVYKRAAG